MSLSQTFLPDLFPHHLFLPTTLPPCSYQNNHAEVQLKSGLLSTLKISNYYPRCSEQFGTIFMLMHATLSHFSNHRSYWSGAQCTSRTWLPVLMIFTSMSLATLCSPDFRTDHTIIHFSIFNLGTIFPPNFLS